MSEYKKEDVKACQNFQLPRKNNATSCLVAVDDLSQKTDRVKTILCPFKSLSFNEIGCKYFHLVDKRHEEAKEGKVCFSEDKYKGSFS